MLGKKRDVILFRKKNVSTRGKSLKVSVPNKGKQKKATAERYHSKTKFDISGESIKVYCRNCVDLVLSRNGGYNCHTESNKVIEKNRQKWLSPDTEFSLKEHPSSKNHNNLCPDFIEKIG